MDLLLKHSASLEAVTEVRPCDHRGQSLKMKSLLPSCIQEAFHFLLQQVCLYLLLLNAHLETSEMESNLHNDVFISVESPEAKNVFLP